MKKVKLPINFLEEIVKKIEAGNSRISTKSFKNICQN